MTVREIIELLQELNQDAPVFISTEDRKSDDVTLIESHSYNGIHQVLVG
jgi:hypothetical protein